MPSVPRPRFKSPGATPPGGVYEYELNGEVVRDRSNIRIALLVERLRTKHGLPSIGGGMRYVMEYMCPKLPDGFCTTPSSNPPIRASDVKLATVPCFAKPVATSDVIEERIATCVACKEQRTSGFCMDCGNLLGWVYEAFGTRRPRLPADHVTGVCQCDKTLVVASASVADPASEIQYPANCWHKTTEAKT